jgi:hypothetical protein
MSAYRPTAAARELWLDEPMPPAVVERPKAVYRAHNCALQEESVTPKIITQPLIDFYLRQMGFCRRKKTRED